MDGVELGQARGRRPDGPGTPLKIINQPTVQMPPVKSSWVNIFLHHHDIIIHNYTDLIPEFIFKKILG